MRFLRVGEKEIPVSICGNDLSRYSIVVGVRKTSMGRIDATPQAMRAAKELKKYLAAVTGVALPISSDKNPIVKSCEIAVGPTDRDRPDREFGTEEYEIKTVGERLIINGGRRGVLYGVYEFLEKYVGLRFFAEDLEKIVDRDRIEIRDIRDSYKPVFEYREICDWTAFDTEFAVKNRINGRFIRSIPDEWGGGIGWAGGDKGLVHTFSHLVPYDEYFASDPTLYALDENGERNPTGLCLTNPKTYRAALKTAKKWLAEAGKEDILSISVNDGNIAYCHCPECEKVRSIEGGESGGVLMFVNRIARAVKKEFPSAVVDTIAYGKIAEVPNVTRPADGVVVRVCGNLVRSNSYADFGREPLLSEQPQCVTFDRKMREWKKICKKIYVWDYPAPYSVINSIFPQFHTFLPNVRYFLENNVRGVYINGNTDTARFSALTTYLIAKLLYRPEMTDEEYETVFSEALQGFYGKGYEHIREFIELTRERATDNRVFTSHTLPPDMLSGDYPDEKLVARMHECFRKAEEEAESDGEKYRIRKDSLQVDYYELYSLTDGGVKNIPPERLAEIERRNKTLYDELVRFGILRVVENTFLPVVNDFRQSPSQWGYWDGNCVTGDRNNNNYRRDVYAILDSAEPLGERVNVTFSFMTNNVNPACFGCVFGGDGYEFITDDRGEKIPLVWDEWHDYRTVTVKGARVCSLKDIAAFEGKETSFSGYCFIQPHRKGVIFIMKNTDAGAYFMIKDVRIEKA